MARTKMLSAMDLMILESWEKKDRADRERKPAFNMAKARQEMDFSFGKSITSDACIKTADYASAFDECMEGLEAFPDYQEQLEKLYKQALSYDTFNAKKSYYKVDTSGLFRVKQPTREEEAKAIVWAWNGGKYDNLAKRYKKAHKNYLDLVAVSGQGEVLKQMFPGECIPALGLYNWLEAVEGQLPTIKVQNSIGKEKHEELCRSKQLHLYNEVVDYVNRAMNSGFTTAEDAITATVNAYKAVADFDSKEMSMKDFGVGALMIVAFVVCFISFFMGIKGVIITLISCVVALVCSCYFGFRYERDKKQVV